MTEQAIEAGMKTVKSTTGAEPVKSTTGAEPVESAAVAEPVESAAVAGPVESATVAETRNPSLRELCETRQLELMDALGRLGDDASPQTRRDIEAALDALGALLTGNLDQIPPVVAAQLSRWIESSKYLGAKETREAASRSPA